MLEPPEVVVAAKRLYKRFASFEAVAGVDFEIRRGEVFGFLGPNGAGKTSTMRMVSCLSPRTDGTLEVLGLDPDVAGSEIRRRLGVVPQEDALDGELTVLDNLVVYGRYFDLPRREARRRAEALLEFAQLTERGRTAVQNLSGGMKRRLTLARALISSPEIVILDEPTTGLDPQARHLVWDRLYRLKQEGVTLILTTHYMDEAEQLCDRLVVMDRGHIVAEGAPRALVAAQVSREVLELRLDGASLDAVLAVGGIEHHELLADRVLLYTSDADALLDAVRRTGVQPLSELVRRATLEDVFLRLTGRTLVE